MFVAERFYIRQGVEIFSDALAQDAIASAVQDANLLDVELNGVINEIGHGLKSLVGAHASYVDFLLKLKLLGSHVVGSGG